MQHQNKTPQHEYAVFEYGKDGNPKGAIDTSCGKLQGKDVLPSIFASASFACGYNGNKKIVQLGSEKQKLLS